MSEAIESAKGKAQPDYLERTKSMLKSKLSEDEYQRFLGSLFLSGVRIANASGPWFGSKISEEEKNMLAGFGASWDLDIKTIEKHFS